MTNEELVSRMVTLFNLTCIYVVKTVEEKGYKRLEDIKEPALKEMMEQVLIISAEDENPIIFN